MECWNWLAVPPLCLYLFALHVACSFAFVFACACARVFNRFIRVSNVQLSNNDCRLHSSSVCSFVKFLIHFVFYSSFVRFLILLLLFLGCLPSVRRRFWSLSFYFQFACGSVQSQRLIVDDAFMFNFSLVRPFLFEDTSMKQLIMHAFRIYSFIFHFDFPSLQCSGFHAVILCLLWWSGQRNLSPTCQRHGQYIWAIVTFRSSNASSKRTWPTRGLGTCKPSRFHLWSISVSARGSCLLWLWHSEFISPMFYFIQFSGPVDQFFAFRGRGQFSARPVDVAVLGVTLAQEVLDSWWQMLWPLSFWTTSWSRFSCTSSSSLSQFSCFPLNKVFTFCWPHLRRALHGPDFPVLHSVFLQFFASGVLQFSVSSWWDRQVLHSPFVDGDIIGCLSVFHSSNFPVLRIAVLHSDFQIFRRCSSPFLHFFYFSSCRFSNFPIYSRPVRQVLYLPFVDGDVGGCLSFLSISSVSISWFSWCCSPFQFSCLVSVSIFLSLSSSDFRVLLLNFLDSSSAHFSVPCWHSALDFVARCAQWRWHCRAGQGGRHWDICVSLFCFLLVVPVSNLLHSINSLSRVISTHIDVSVCSCCYYRFCNSCR